MNYSPFIPSSVPNEDQDDILMNFQTLNDQWDVNHTPLTSVAQNGYHDKLFFFQDNEDPGLITPRSALYPKYITYKQDTADQFTRPELFFQNNSTNADIRQLVDLVESSTGTQVARNKNGIGMKTPWGLTFNFCQVKSNAPASSVVYDWPVSYSTIIYTVTLTGYGSNSNLDTSGAWVNTVTINNFKLTSNGSLLPDGSNTKNYYVWAIGK